MDKKNLKPGTLVWITRCVTALDEEYVKRGGPLWVIKEERSSYAYWATCLGSGERHWWYDTQFEVSKR